MKELLEEGNLDFFYTNLAYTKSLAALNRVNELNMYWLPTTYFDDGYLVQVGASASQVKQQFTVKINTCGFRTVNDIDIDLKVNWLGNATMDMDVTVTNKNPRVYEGTVRLLITELVSSLNWRDSANKLYRFPLLAYAMDETLNIPANGGTFNDSVVWNGNDHTSGMGSGGGQSYGNIDYDNIMIIAVVRTSEARTAYSDPPSGRPFDSYWVDETAGTMPATLWSDVTEVPEAGGTVNFTISADEDNAGRNYILLGGASGTDPGTVLPGGEVLPINFDWFTDVEFILLNTANFANFLGVLDANGQATPQLVVPPIAGAAGTVLYFSATCNNPFDYVSNVVEVEIVP